MQLYTENEGYRLFMGDMNDMETVIERESIDSIVTDPPYELGFMNKAWDSSGVAFQPDTWKRCFNVLKSGGYLLAFGGSRTFHRIACAIEDAGFEIRDTIMWIYGSGFSKSMNIGLAIDRRNGAETVLGNEKVLQTEEARKWEGWGTCLKPAYEPIIIARKPLKGSCIDNVMTYGTGGINIDECRVPMGKKDIDMINAKASKNPTDNYNHNEAKKYGDYALSKASPANEQGRFPSNVILTYDETDEQEVCGGFPYTKSNGDIDGSASRYFYCAKASKRDRDEGLDELPDKPIAFSNQAQAELKRGGELQGDGLNLGFLKILVRKNIHPTVKPVSLMQYLVRLVTPKGGTVLDPFNGSGSTGKAVMYENKDRDAGYKYIGIDMSEEYLAISKARIDHVIRLQT